MKNGKEHFPESELLTHTNGTGSVIAAGSFVKTGGIFGVAQTDIAANGGTGTLHTRGRFGVPKAAGAGTALVVGDRGTVASGNFVKSAGGPLHVVQAAGDNDTEVTVNLNAPPLHRGSARVVVSSGQAGTNTNGRVDIVTGLGVEPAAVTVLVRTVSTGVIKSGYVVNTSAVAGTIRIDGVSNPQLVAGDIIDVTWEAA